MQMNYFVIWIPERLKIEYLCIWILINIVGLFLSDKVLNEKNYSTHLLTSLPKSSPCQIALCPSYDILLVFIIHDSTL